MSDLREKIDEVVANAYINGKTLNAISVAVEVFVNQHAQERAVAFAKFISKNDWTYSYTEEKWFQMRQGIAVNWKTDAELYQLFYNETKQK